ncbi:SDR family NAD(P)-dependent oxidoreductase [Phyllobacterium chamaecytisi]|uniref:SDR family NAD(P)-dependent oxidoreductase n=1 Tax=Phyllobacterium chamaecytisi TaxID=2876082 RepID=UPI001CCCA2A5|nr:SDR family oxidoreductase [Phyllobacterium sp. KW56]MBZ9605906.1 SDR family oxidoreductase [Phyllobacterium sp. KW56]
MMNSATRKVAAITGASSGIGSVYADRFAARGYDLILIARRGERLAALSGQLSAVYGVEVEVISADLTKEADLVRVAGSLADSAALRVLVNNAGNSRLAPLADTSAAESASMIALNIVALTRLTEAVLPSFLSQKDGLIINIASVLSLHALPTSAIYSGTKGYVLNLSRGLQQELAGTGVRLQVVLPGTTATELWDLSGVPLASLNKAKIMSAEDMVDAALAGLDNHEDVTLPSVADASLWDAYDAARSKLFLATQTGKTAPRYAKS